MDNLNNQQKAILDMISYAEGTAGVSKNGYDVTFNFYKIPNWDINYKLGHQDSGWKVTSGNITSTAAGRYQFLGFKWKEISKKILKINNAPFNRDNQNILGAALIDGRNKRQVLRKGKVIIPKPPSLDELSKDNFHLFLDSIAPEWASIPFSLNGGSGFFGKQNGKYTSDELYKIYEESLKKYIIRS